MTTLANALTTDELRSRIARVPRTPLAHLPTPLELLPRFSQAVSTNGPRIWIKRDDCTGLLFGGNKARHNEFLIADALAKGADLVVWARECRATTADRQPPHAPRSDSIFIWCSDEASRQRSRMSCKETCCSTTSSARASRSLKSRSAPLDQKIAEVAERFRSRGRKVYLWDRPVVLPLAALSYTLCMAEIVEQSTVSNFEPAAVYVSSSGSTGAGVALGAKALGVPYPVKSIAPMIWPWDSPQELSATANRAAELAGIETRLIPDDILFIGDYLGPGYGQPSDAGIEAMTLLARTEGILVEHVYTAKVLSGLIDHIRTGHFRADQDVVFVHTGGTPAIFAEAEMLATRIPRRVLN